MLSQQALLAIFIAAGTAGGFMLPSAGKLLAPALAPLLMGIIFLSSLKMRPAELLEDLRSPKRLLMSMAVMLLVMPLLGALLQFFYPLEPLSYAGVLLYLASPAAASSAFFAEVLRGHPASSLRLAGFSTLLCILTIPLVMLLLAGAQVSVDPARMLSVLVQIIIIPFAGAALFRRYLPKASAILMRFSFSLSLLLLFLIFFAFVGAGYEEVVGDLKNFIMISAVITVLIFASFAVSYALARILGLDSATLTLATGVKNGSIGLFVALSAFGPAAVPPIIAGGLLNVFVMLAFGRLTSARAPRAAGAPPQTA